MKITICTFKGHPIVTFRNDNVKFNGHICLKIHNEEILCVLLTIVTTFDFYNFNLRGHFGGQIGQLS